MAKIKLTKTAVETVQSQAQAIEQHVRVALLNRFTQLGRPSTVPVPAMA